MVPTPIGNLNDMTYRAIEILNTADAILAEDTRTSGRLLKHFDISTPMKSYHQHNEHKVVEALVARIANGETLALITDAGTPAISDPGYLIVKQCVNQGVAVETLPGATAFIPALVNSGLPNDRFCFEGFLPPKKGRQKRLQQLKTETRTLVFYESPYRLLKTLAQLSEVLGQDRQASISRELTKLHEETVHGTLQELHAYYEQHPLKGELVLVVAGAD